MGFCGGKVKDRFVISPQDLIKQLHPNGWGGGGGLIFGKSVMTGKFKSLCFPKSLPFHFSYSTAIIIITTSVMLFIFDL